MDIMLSCQSCQTPLRVPRSASGHRARCPACGAQFVVPADEELLEETISTWIEQDVDEILTHRDQVTEQQMIASLQRSSEEVNQTAASLRNASTPSVDARSADDDPARSRSEIEQDAAAPEPPSPPEPPETSPAVPPAAPPEPALEGDLATRPLKLEADAAVEQVDAPAPRRSPGHTPRSAPSDGYPQGLVAEQPGPHLVVRRCDHAGVRFAFDADWLNHPGFRASLPVRCVFSGNANRAQLIARPLVFLDQYRTHKLAIDQLTSLHEHRVLGDHSSRELMRMMGQLESLPHPFNAPMPYFVSTRYAHLYLHCETHDRSDGTTCEVVVPDAVCGLDWLTRVNGVCGKDYERLEHDASLLHGEAWRTLSDACRQRIGTWCKLRPREVLRLYLSDADFGRRDDGLAGLIVTDQRLVFCKYHHRGDVPLDTEDAAILAKCDKRFANLTLQLGADRSRMVKLHFSDLDRLAQALDEAGEIRVHVSE